jgi:hypothetical protein
MSPQQPAIDALRQISNEIGAFLQDWPLYRTFTYRGDNWTPTGGSYPGSVGFTFSFPDNLRLYCSDEDCQKLQTWEIYGCPYLDQQNRPRYSDSFAWGTFRCRNCRRSMITYALHFNVGPMGGEITKVGQWPPLSRAPDPVVVAGWSQPDLALYRDAMTFRNSNKGIGSLPYLRRIIENHIHDVLDLIAATHKRKPIPNFDPAKYEDVRAGRRFSDKLDFARDYLPPDLTPSGSPNPIGTLYELISEGIHERSEEAFARCSACSMALRASSPFPR